jgi:hypothetical protein
VTTIANTTQLALRDLFETRIRQTTPVLVPEQSERWKPYRGATDTASRMRRCRLVFTPGTFFKLGYFTNTNVETTAALSIRTDYATRHQDIITIIQSDWHQLRERLSGLTADPANGLVWLETTTSPPVEVAETGEGRRALSERALNSRDFAVVDLTYNLRYMRARAAA